MRILSIVCLICATVAPLFGCEKGRYTNDHHYVGNPERLPATSESPTAPEGVSPSGVTGLPPADPRR
jgi:hypothetical protein